MAPALSTFGRLADTAPISKRSVSVPGCVLVCMLKGDTTGCQSYDDYICLCDSTAYTTSVMSCWNVNCNATEYTAGVMYTTDSCQALGVNLVPATTTGVNAAVATIITVAPVVYSYAAWDIQAVMSSVCSVILVLSIVFGIFSCRAQARRNGTVTTQRTWNGLPSQSDAKSRNNNTRGARSHLDTLGDITTVDLTRTVDLSSSYTGPTTNRPNGRGGRGGASGFTNRLPPDTLASWNEAHEMRSMDGTASAHAESSRRASGSGSASGSDSDDLQIKTPRMSAQRFGRGAGAVVGGDGDDDTKIVPKETVLDGHDDDRLSGHAIAGHSLAEELDERLDGDVDAVRTLSLVPEMGASLPPSTPTGTFHHASEYGSSVNLARTYSTEHGERERF